MAGSGWQEEEDDHKCFKWLDPDGRKRKMSMNVKTSR